MLTSLDLECVLEAAEEVLPGGREREREDNNRSLAETCIVSRFEVTGGRNAATSGESGE